MIKILILDDEPAIALGTERLLQKKIAHTLETSVAYSAQQALEIMRRVDIDILLSDIRMPGMSGLELLRETHALWPDCRVIFLSGYSEFEYIYEATRVSGVRYCLKTEPDEDLLKTVEETIQEILHERQQPVQPAEAKRRMESLRNADHKIIARLHQYIEEHPGGDLSLTNLAGVVFLNPSYLSRFYKAQTGKNLSETIAAVKLDKALTLLRDPRLKIADIAAQLGFESPSYFSVFIRGMTGRTAQELREQIIEQSGKENDTM